MATRCELRGSSPRVDSGVMLQGYVYRPGSFAWHEGLKLTDVIGSIDELKPNADSELRADPPRSDA